MGANVTSKLCTNVILLCGQIYDKRKQKFRKMSTNVIAPSLKCTQPLRKQTKPYSLYLAQSVLSF